VVELHGYSSRDWSVLSQAGGLWEEEGLCQPVVSGLGSAFTRLGDGNPTPSSDSDRWDFQSSGPSCQIAREIYFPSIFRLTKVSLTVTTLRGLFTLTHHMVVWLAAKGLYPGKGLWDYTILGDDTVIADSAVAQSYLEIMAE